MAWPKQKIPNKLLSNSNAHRSIIHKSRKQNQFTCPPTDESICTHTHTHTQCGNLHNKKMNKNVLENIKIILLSEELWTKKSYTLYHSIYVILKVGKPQ